MFQHIIYKKLLQSTPARHYGDEEAGEEAERLLLGAHGGGRGRRGHLQGDGEAAPEDPPAQVGDQRSGV